MLEEISEWALRFCCRAQSILDCGGEGKTSVARMGSPVRDEEVTLEEGWQCRLQMG